MAENKTKPTSVSVSDHLAAIGNEVQRRDAEQLAALLQKITGEAPCMWGPTIVGFGSYHYKYESGREGDSCLTGFAVRKNEFALYLVAAGPEHDALLAALGRHKMSKACLYIKRLEDVKLDVLEKLIRGSISEVRRRYG